MKWCIRALRMSSSSLSIYEKHYKQLYNSHRRWFVYEYLGLFSFLSCTDVGFRLIHDIDTFPSIYICSKIKSRAVDIFPFHITWSLQWSVWMCLWYNRSNKFNFVVYPYMVCAIEILCWKINKRKITNCQFDYDFQWIFLTIFFRCWIILFNKLFYHVIILRDLKQYLIF